VPHSHYPTKDGRWVAIACTTDKMFQRLARLMGRPELAGDGPYGTYAKRDSLRDEVDAVVAEWTASHERAELLQSCEVAQVPAGPILSIDEIFEDPQYASRGNVATHHDERVGDLAVPNVVPRLTATPGGIDWLGPALGAYNDDVYEGLLGLSPEQIAQLRSEGVL
jgi:crotonobetainyl-CoA:carnitine CoA-transferase CaiB-like acyl-CoA transferase